MNKKEKEKDPEQKLRDKIVCMIETCGKRLLPSIQTEIYSMILEYKENVLEPKTK